MLTKREEKLFKKLLLKYIKKILIPGFETVYNFNDESDVEEIQAVISSFQEAFGPKESNNSIIQLITHMKMLLKEKLYEYGHFPENAAEAEGFLTFRLRFFEMGLNSIYDITLERVEEYLNYLDFVHFMQSIIVNQPKENKTIIVKILEDGIIKLFSDDGEAINESFYAKHNLALSDQSTSSDIAIGLLVSIAPSTIVLSGKKELNETFCQCLTDVFKGMAIIKQEP